jgi:class 3 adenylate cyclase
VCGTPLRERSTEQAALPPKPTRPTGTPGHLADNIRTDGVAMAGERKHVTALFADVVGSMDLAERIDPEEWRQLMERFFAILSSGVQRFEGTVDKFTGDGIMALSGAPVAHEDHAQRACFAALHLQRVLSELGATGQAERLARDLAIAAR